MLEFGQYYLQPVGWIDSWIRQQKEHAKKGVLVLR